MLLLQQASRDRSAQSRPSCLLGPQGGEHNHLTLFATVSPGGSGAPSSKDTLRSGKDPNASPWRSLPSGAGGVKVLPLLL